MCKAERNSTFPMKNMIPHGIGGRYESSVIQLSADISFLYGELILEDILDISLERLAAILARRVSGLYNLSPLQVHLVDREKGDIRF